MALAGLVLCAALLARAEMSPSDPEPREARLSWTPAETVGFRLARSRALAGARVQVEGDAGTVTLTGAVRDPLQRERAKRIASQTAGVGKVRDELRVDASLAAPALLSDEELARQVALKLASASTLQASAKQGWTYGWRVEGDGWELDVEVDDGDVSLEGVVLLQPHIPEFVTAAREVSGVRSVRAELELRPNPAPELPFDQ